MYKNTFLTALGFVFLSGLSPAHAALIDNGGSTIDTSTSLEWLDLTYTVGFTVADALTAHSDYSYGTDTQVAGLLAAFNTTYQFNPGGYVDLGAAESDRANFISLLGDTDTSTDVQSLGAFDVDGRNAYLCMAINYSCGPESFVRDVDIVPNHQAGIFLVRDAVTTVPIPATAWLLGSALLGLAKIARRKRA
jgi:hypothetical protein